MINFRTPKCAKNSLFSALLILAHSCCVKINGARKLMGLGCLLNHHLKNNSRWPSGHQNLLSNILKSYCCKQQETFSPELLSADALTSVRYRQKCPTSQIEFKLNSFSDSKAGHCKNLSGLTYKICSKILQKVRPVTLIKNIF